LETGESQNPSHDKVQRLASALGVTIDELWQETANPRPLSLREHIEGLRYVLPVEVPIISCIPCGEFYPEDGVPANYVYIAKEDLGTVRNPYALKAVGESLAELGIEEGDVLIVDPDASSLGPDKICIVRTEDGVAARRCSNIPPDAEILGRVILVNRCRRV